jgi:acetyl esterase/lipase
MVRVGRVCVATLVLLVGAATSCAGDDEPNAAPVTPTTASPRAPLIACGGRATVQYAVHDGVAANSTSLDVYRPAPGDDECTDRPLVIWIHGGGWTDGDKAENIADKVRLFTDAGYVFASLNYRLTDITVDPAAPTWPVHDQDSADGVGWLVAHADELGIDTDRIATFGHSAGGGITAAITTDDQYLGHHGLGIDAIRCAGSIDAEGYDVTVGATHPDPNVNLTYLNAFGPDPANWAPASPMTHIAAGKGIPSYFVAARGTDMRLDLHAEFVAALRTAGVPVTVVDARTLDHGEVSDDIGAPGDTVMTPAVMDFLGQCFTAEGP